MKMRKIPPTSPRNLPITYERVYEKIKNSKLLTQRELIVLNGMRKNAKQVNQRKIVKEVKLMPTKQQVEEVVKQVEKKKTPAEVEKEEYSNKAIEHIFNVLKVAKYTPQSAEQVYNQGRQYFLLCEQNSIMPTSSGLSMALGMRRKQLLAIATGEIRVQYQEVYQTLWQMLEVYDEAMMKQGKTNAIVGIFNQKNNHGWVDKVEVIHGGDRTETDDEIKKRYEDVIDIEENQKKDTL